MGAQAVQRFWSSGHLKSKCALTLALLLCMLGCESKKTPPTTTKATPSQTPEASKTATTQKAAQTLRPPAEAPKPEPKPGELPFEWEETQGEPLRVGQAVLYVPRAEYLALFGAEHLHLKYRPGRITAVNKQEVEVVPYGSPPETAAQAIPAQMTIAMSESAEVQPGQMVVSWSQTPTPYFQRAIVEQGGKRPHVVLLDLAIPDQPQAEVVLEPGTFRPVSSSPTLQIGHSVTWRQDGHERYGVLLRVSDSHVLLRGFGQEVFSLTRDRVQLVPTPAPLAAGQEVKAPLLNRYVDARILSLDKAKAMVRATLGEVDIDYDVPKVDLKVK